VCGSLRKLNTELPPRVCEEQYPDKKNRNMIINPLKQAKLRNIGQYKKCAYNENPPGKPEGNSFSTHACG
jgi:hypothetical protein